MSSNSFDPELSDVNNDGYIHATKSVGTSQVLIAVGASNREGRELLYIENNGTTKLYVGATGVTATGATKGAELAKKQFEFLPAGELVDHYVISDAPGGSFCVREWA